MARTRLAVALLPPAGLAAELDTLRRAVGSGTLGRVPVHLTLVPPVNVRAEELGLVRRTLATAAAATRPFEVALGPAATFAPRTPTLHLAVGGADAELTALRDALRVGPLDRPGGRPFVPHVTLDDAVDPALVPGAVATLCGVGFRWRVRSVYLLEEHRDATGARWVPCREEPLGGPAVVGRGGAELRLRTLAMVDAAAAELAGVPRRDPHPPTPSAGAPVTVTAHHAGGAGDATPDGGEPAGVAVGAVRGALADLESVVVAPPSRGQGVGAHLLARWCAAAVAAGATFARCAPPAGDAGRSFLERHGWTAVGAALVRGL